MKNPTLSLNQQVLLELGKLPLHAIQEVLDFIGYLQTKYTAEQPQRGSAKALLSCWGQWQFTPQEQQELDSYIQQLREIPDDRLPA